jgi:hypothetical protein
LFIVALPIFAARMYTRYRSAARLRADDLIIAVAFVR